MADGPEHTRDAPLPAPPGGDPPTGETLLHWTPGPGATPPPSGTPIPATNVLPPGTRPGGETPAAPTPHTRLPLGPAPARLGPYEILGELGRGGMGVVYRARRPDLGRDFALKVIRPDRHLASDTVARFRREAMAAARLSAHPGIIAVHDIGEHEGQVYFAMDLVEGRRLDQVVAGDGMAPRDAAACIERVARALHHAHTQGVLHRDVKPSNVLVGRRVGAATGTAPDAAEADAVFLTDFGLARVEAATGDLARLTRSDMMLGTPAYMPPEQARGEQLDARADVYALGATLYEALVGHPPFQADSMHRLIVMVFRDPPPSLRAAAPHVPAALEAIAMRCLAKAPVDRYPSAAALADDLARFLGGTAVSATPASGWFAPNGFLARHRRSATALAASTAVVVALVAGGAWLSGRFASTAGQLDHAEQGTATAEGAARYSAIYAELAAATRAPLVCLSDAWHGAGVSEQAVTEALAAIDAATEAVQRRVPDSPQPAAFRTLANFFAEREGARDALAELVAGTGDDPVPALLVARARTAAYAWHVDLPAYTVREGRFTVQTLDESDFAAETRARALAAVHAARARPAIAQLTEGREYVTLLDGVGDLVEDRPRRAIDRLAPLMDHPDLAREAANLVGLAYYQSGDFRSAIRTWEHALTRGWPKTGQWLTAAYGALGSEVESRDEDPRPIYQELIGRLSNAIAQSPDRPALRRMRARGTLWLAQAEALAGHDPRPDFARALADLDLAVAADPAQPEAIEQRAGVRLEAYLAGADRAAPDRAVLLGALEDVEQLARAHPGHPRALYVFARAYGEASRDNSATPAERRDRLERSAAACSDLIAIEGDEAVVAAWLFRGHARLRLAEMALSSGRDPVPAIRAALEDYHQVITRDPEPIEGWTGRGNACFQLAQQLQMGGADPRGALTDAVEAFDRSLAAAPKQPLTLNSRALARRDLGEAAAAIGEDPVPHYEAALVDFTAGMALAANETTLRLNRADTYRLLGEVQQRRGEDPLATFRLGLADMDRAIALESGHSEHHGARANLHYSIAEALARADEDPMPEFAAAVADAEMSVARAPEDLRGWASLGNIRRAQAERQRRRGEDPLPALAASLRAFDRALAILADHPIVRYQRAQAHQVAAEVVGHRTEEAVPHLERMLADLDVAVARNPAMGPAHTARGTALRLLGRAADARTAYHRALEIRPNDGIARQGLELLGADAGR